MNAKKIDQSASSKTASGKAAAQVGKKTEELQGSRLLSDIEAFKAGCIANDGKRDAKASDILSLEPSADFDFAMKAMSFLEERKDEVWEQVDIYEKEFRDGRFRGDLDGWREWTKGTPHSLLLDQHETLCDLAIALEKFVRARDCQTIGDLVAKVQLNAFWMKGDMRSFIDDYSEEACLVIRSIMPLVERLTANRG